MPLSTLLISVLASCLLWFLIIVYPETMFLIYTAGGLACYFVGLIRADFRSNFQKTFR